MSRWLYNIGLSTKGERVWEVSLQIGWGEGPFSCPDGSETGGRTALCRGSIPPRTFPPTCPLPDLESGPKTKKILLPITRNFGFDNN